MKLDHSKGMKKREEPMRTPRFLHEAFEGTVLGITGGAFYFLLLLFFFGGAF